MRQNHNRRKCFYVVFWSLLGMFFNQYVLIAAKQSKKESVKGQNAAATVTQVNRQNARTSSKQQSTQFSDAQCLELVDNCPVSNLPTETLGSDTDPAHFKLYCDLTVEQGPFTIQNTHDVPFIDDSDNFPEGLSSANSSQISPQQTSTRTFKRVDGICYFNPNKEALLFKFADKALLAPGASVDLTFVTTVWDNLIDPSLQHPIPVSFSIRNLHVHPVMDEGSYDPTKPLSFVTANVLVDQICPTALSAYNVIVGVGGHNDTRFLVPTCFDPNPPCAVPGLLSPNITNKFQYFLRVGFRKCFPGPGNRNYVKLTIYPGADDEFLASDAYKFNLDADCQAVIDTFLGTIGLDNGETFIKNAQKSALRIDAGLLSYTVYSPNLKDSAFSNAPNPLCGVDIIRCDSCLDDCLDDLSQDQLLALLELLQSILGGGSNGYTKARPVRIKQDAERVRERVSQQVKHPGLDIIFDELVRSVGTKSADEARDQLSSLVRSVEFAVEKRQDS